MIRKFVIALVAMILAGCSQQPPAPPPSALLLDTYWRVAEIEGKPYLARPGTREPHLLLSGNRVTGFTGCNNLAGSFEQEAQRLRFKPLATTRMACLPHSDIETQYLSALEATATYRITGGVLELLDSGGKARMRLEARGSK